MSSLTQHLNRVKAQKQAQAQNKDPRLSAQVRFSKSKLALTTALVASQTLEQKQGEQSQPNDLVKTTQLDVKFFHAWQQMSNIQSHEAKKAKKAELLPDYTPWIEGTIAEGVGSQNDMLIKLMVWCLDAHNLELATRIAQFALLNNMVMPEPFTRDIATVYAEQMSEEGLNNIDNIADYADIYQQAVDITNSHDMPDQVRAKLYRTWGNSQKDTHPADAIVAYERALKLDANVGCKQNLKSLAKTD